jgi:hypothetical protein
MGGSIIYVGHSKGSTLIFMYASEYSEESKSLLKGIIALSPIAYLEPRSHIQFLFTVTPTYGVNSSSSNCRQNCTSIVAESSKSVGNSNGFLKREISTRIFSSVLFSLATCLSLYYISGLRKAFAVYASKLCCQHFKLI